MREYTAPETVTIADDFNVVSALFERESREPDAKAFAIRDGDHFVDITLGAFCDEVRVMAAGLVGLGIEPGSAICLFSHTRYEFTILDYAILAAGCVTVPIYETDSADQVKWAATNSSAVAIVVENATLQRNVDAVAADLPGLRHTVLIDGAASTRSAPRPRTSIRPRSRSGGRRSPTTSWRRSSTPRAPPACPRAACSPTATSPARWEASPS